MPSAIGLTVGTSLPFEWLRLMGDQIALVFFFCFALCFIILTYVTLQRLSGLSQGLLGLIRNAAFAILAFVFGIMLVGPEAQRLRAPFLCDAELRVERVSMSDFGQLIQCRVEEMYQPAPDRVHRVSCYFPPVPVLSINDQIHVRGLCEWDDKYLRWKLRVSEMVQQQQGPPGPRARMIAAVENLPRHQGIASALLLGLAPAADKALFRQAGIAHVLVVSGLHVGIVFMLCALLLRGAAVPWYPAQGILIGMLIYYMWLTAAAVPTQRAVLMAGIIIMGNLIGRDLHRYAALSLTVIILIIMDPLTSRSLSFQLSAVAVAGILTLGLSLRDLRLHYMPLKAWPLDRPLWRLVLWMARGAMDGLAVGIAASLAVMPFLALHMDMTNPWSPLATVLVCPLLVMIIACGSAYLACTSIWLDGPWQGLMVLTDWALHFLFELTTGLAQLPGAVLAVSAPSVFALCLWPLLFIPFSGLRQLAIRIALLITIFIAW